jgi:hypothetical protein
MAKIRYSNSKKGKGHNRRSNRTRGKKSRHTRHTKHHIGRRHRRTRRGGNTPGAPKIMTFLKPDQLLSGGPQSFQRGGSATSTGGSMVYKGGQWDTRTPAGGRA